MSKYKINTDLIISYLKENHISKKDFSKLCKTSVYTLNKILNGYTNFSIMILIRIVRILNIEFYKIFEPNDN